jgi:IS30 family transposase
MKTKILVVQTDNNNYHHLNQEQRIYIAKRISKWISLRQIWRELGVHHSTISKEIKRNSIDKWRGVHVYDPFKAQEIYTNCKRKAAKKRKLSIKYPNLFKLIEQLLTKRNWSPIQIAWRLKLELNFSISPNTIYRRIRNDKPKLQIYLRYKRHPPKKWKKYNYKHKIKGKHISNINMRDKKINERKRLWDFEMDTIVSSRKWNWWIITLVDRLSRYVIAIKVNRVWAKEVYEELKRLKGKVMIKTITSDNWSEFVLAEEIVKELWIERWYLCDPYSSWQRWTNERTNWLIRWFIPKWTDLSKVTQEAINKIVDILNLMPRKIHNFLTPYEIFFNTRINLIS